MHILVVDDRDDARYLLTSLLAGHGHQVTAANHGGDALNRLRAGHRFDLIISDILMPVLDGFQLCHQVKSNPDWRAIPFIFYTATYTGAQDEDFARKLGADCFLRKPCDPAELLAAIAEVTVPSGAAMPSAAGALPDEERLRLYSERLVRKLEQKMLQAEESAAALTAEKNKLASLIAELPLGLATLDERGSFVAVNPRFTEVFGYAITDLATIDGWIAQAVPDEGVAAQLRTAWRQLGSEPDRGDAGRGPESSRPSPAPTAAPGDSCAQRPGTARGDAPRVEGSRSSLAPPLPTTGVGHPSAVQAEIRCQNGTPRHARIHLVTLSDGQRVMTCEDVSEQVTLESRLRQARKLEAIATLASGIAHDFNNLLSAIVGFTDRIETGAGGAEGPGRALEGIRIAVHRARQLVRQILASSRQSPPERAPLALHLVVREVLALVGPTLPPGVTVREDLDREALTFADQTQLHQVLMNLCTNAGRALRGRDGTLTVRLARESLAQPRLLPDRVLPAGCYLHLSVQDTGCGIDPAIIDRIFDPYFTTCTDGEGAGLGLSVSRGIVESHGGTIEVESTPGRGTTFHVLLPAIDHPAVDPALETPALCPTGCERILFIDDEPALASIGQQLLEALGYRVVSHTRPREALELFCGDPAAFDLLITDLTMPGLTGLELAAQARAARADLPVIVCSGIGSGPPGISIAPGTVSAFLAKPYSRLDLAQVVRQVLDPVRAAATAARGDFPPGVGPL